MSFWMPESLRAVVAGSWIVPPGVDASGRPVTPSGLSTDTRTLKPGEAFLALRGDRFDGHAMLGAAAAAGATLAIVDAPDRIGAPPAGLAVMRVMDARRALLQLAAAYRDKLTRTTVIAVCGSNGKTTTVRLIDAVLSRAMAGSASKKSYNNAIGVPLTVLAARPTDGYLICELGTNAKGEIAALARAVRPDIAVVTSIGREHLERLGSVREVAREEASVLEFVRRGGAGVVHAEAPHLLETIASLPEKPAAIIRFGDGPAADVRVVDVAHGWREGAGGRLLTPVTEFTLNDRSVFSVPMPGHHNALNAAAAVAVGRRLGLSYETIAAGLATAQGPEMRLQVEAVGGVRVINDAYNANPDSMRAALSTLATLARGASRRVVVLGDMLELGAHSAAEHAALVADVLARADVDLAVLVGPAMGAAHAEWARTRGGAAHAAGGAGPLFDGRARVVALADLEGGRDRHAAELLEDGDAVLLKGSRGMRLERIVAAMPGRAAAER